jgi:hypothetical protein
MPPDDGILSPRDFPGFSVVSQLIERYFDGTSCEGERGNWKGASQKRNSSTSMEVSEERKPGSLLNLVCIGPVDGSVVNRSEYVRRRIAAALDSLTDDGEICCAVDVGPSVGLCSVADIIAKVHLPPDVTCSAFTGVDPKVNPASVALIVFKKSTC